jgi:hypothetical protein
VTPSAAEAALNVLSNPCNIFSRSTYIYCNYMVKILSGNCQEDGCKEIKKAK